MTKTAEEIKAVATSFFYWWYNTNGTNTADGFDEWAQTDEGKKLLQPHPLPSDINDFIEKELKKYIDEYWIYLQGDGATTKISLGFKRGFTLCYNTYVEPLKEEITDRNNYYEDKIEMLIRIGEENDKENKRLKEEVIEKELRYYFWELLIVPYTCDQVEEKWQQFKMQHNL